MSKDKSVIIHEFLLLFLNLGQLKEKQRIIELFVEAINSRDIGLEIVYFEDNKNKTGELAAISTYESNFGYFQIKGNLEKEDPEFLAVVRNLIKMLAVILENRAREEQLQDKKYESEIEIKTLVDNLAGVVYRCNNDAEWTMQYISGGIENLCGYTADDFISKKYNFKNMIYPLDRDMVRQKVSQALADKTDYVFEYRIRKKNGEECWIHEQGRGIFLPDGELKYLEGILLDINLRKQTETQLLLNSAIINNTTEAVYLVRMDNGEIIYTNQAFERLFGYDSREMIGKHVSIVNDPADTDPQKRAEEIIAALKETGKWQGEVANIKKNGERFLSHANVSVFAHGEYGEVIVAAHTDITESKKTAESLEERQRLLNKVGEIAKIGGWEFDLEQGGKPTWTKGTYDIVELDYDEPIPDINEHVKWYPPEYQAMIAKKMRDLAETEQPMRFDAQFKTKKGNLKWVRAIGEVVKKHGKVIKLRGTFQDITEIKKAEESVLENQERLRRIVDSNMFGIFFWDAQGRISDANKAFLDMVGYTKQELIEGKINWRAITPPEYLAQDERMLKLLQKQETIIPFEKEYIHKNNTRIPILIGVTTLNERNDQGICLILDITHRKKTQELINNLAKFPEENPSPVMRFSARGEIMYANKGAKHCLEAWSIKQGLDKDLLDIIAQTYASGKIKTVEKKCKEKTFLLTLTPILEQHYINIYGLDITPRKLLETALEKRIIAMAQPLNEAEGIDFDVLFNIKEIQELQDLFAKSANVASIITQTDGMPITQPSNFCRLCKDIIRKTEKGLINCLHSDAVIGKYSEKGATIQACLSAGLWDAGASITVGGKHIANWLIGQVRNEEQEKNKIKKYAYEIGADPEEFMRAFEEVPVMSKTQFQNVADTLFVMANLLSSAAYQNIQQARFISERKKAEAALIENNKQFQQLVDNMSSGVAIFKAIENGADFIFQDFNKAGEIIEKISKADVIGKRVTEVFPGAREFGLLDVLKRVFLTGTPERLADKIYKDSRIEGWRRNYVYKVASGELISVYDDVTEDKKIEQQEKEIFAAQAAARVEKQKAEELLKANQTLKLIQEQLMQAEKLASLGQLGAGVAHELNSPLAGILSLLRSYKKEKDPNSVEYADLAEMEKASEHMAKIIKGLNTFSRQSTGEVEEVDCNEAIQTTLSFTAYQLKQKGVGIETALEPDLWKITANENQIQQIIINMMSNACDASFANGVFRIATHNIKIAGKSYVEMLFEDRGTGIPQENLKKIFDPFFTTKRPGGGVGLGLSIVYKIVENHKGTIAVNSKEGQGTIFTIRFPAN
ncbi:MAG: PAS domain S-box protein [Candidatus Omnitrophota bacterium]